MLGSRPAYLLLRMPLPGSEHTLQDQVENASSWVPSKGAHASRPDTELRSLLQTWF